MRVYLRKLAMEVMRQSHKERTLVGKKCLVRETASNVLQKMFDVRLWLFHLLQTQFLSRNIGVHFYAHFRFNRKSKALGFLSNPPWLEQVTVPQLLLFPSLLPQRCC